MNASNTDVKVVDLFCGIGGLSHGFVRKGFTVVAGFDNNADCQFGYEYNNNAKFVEKDINSVSAEEINKFYGDNPKVKVLIGCAPCQPFSKLNQNKITSNQLQPLNKFARLIKEIRPEIVSMENVKGLIKNPIFKKFIKNLEDNNYYYSYQLVDFSDYGVPQRRVRLVLLASRLGEISLIPPTHIDKKVTVRDVISHLNPIKDGEVDQDDYLHRCRSLSSLNKKRILATPRNGGNSRSWTDDLMLSCHKKESGETYRGSVYGRMRWDEPAPTMTTQCIGIGNGRYGHPDQDRAISLREAAIFQTFPRKYRFTEPSESIVMAKVAKFIGNAVPVRAGEVIAESIKIHLKKYGKQ
jgi:DNA (cytosine-5)-methyltransferase 1